MRTKIYKAVAARLKKAGIGIHFISLWNRNSDQLSKLVGFRMPAVFVEFDPIQWTQLPNRARAADVRVRLHILTESLATPEMGGKYQDQALEQLETVEKVSAVVQGLSGDGFNSFMLVESVPDHDHERVQHNEECFVTHVTDNSPVRMPAVAKGLTLVQAEPEEEPGTE